MPLELNHDNVYQLGNDSVRISMNDADSQDLYFEPTIIGGKLRCCYAKRNCSQCGYSFKENKSGHDVRVCPDCGADRRCQMRTTNSPNGRCKRHGQKVPKGPQHAHFKHGQRSGFMASVPDEYRAMVEQYLADPNLLDNTNQIAMLAARWQEQTASLSSGENKFSIQALQELWAELQSTNKSLARARESGDEDGIRKAQQSFTSTMAAIGKMIGAAADKFQAWEDWKETTKDLSALRIDQARMKDFQARYMAAEMVVAIGIALRDAVMKVLNPREHAAELRQIVEELDRVMGNGVMLGRVVGQVQEIDGE